MSIIMPDTLDSLHTYWLGPINVAISKSQKNRIAHSIITPIHSHILLTRKLLFLFLREYALSVSLWCDIHLYFKSV